MKKDVSKERRSSLICQWPVSVTRREFCLKILLTRVSVAVVRLRTSKTKQTYRLYRKYGHYWAAPAPSKRLMQSLRPSEPLPAYSAHRRPSTDKQPNKVRVYIGVLLTGSSQVCIKSYQRPNDRSLSVLCPIILIYIHSRQI